jgi:hypothetical protein
MKIIIHNNKIAEIISGEVIVKSAQDALDLVVMKGIPSPKKIILHRENIAPEFFNLKTGLAWEILQKFDTYQVQIAIVGDFSDIKSESFQALMRESNRGTQTFFISTVEAAKEKLG